jgi:hypothetical protein
MLFNFILTQLLMKNYLTQYVFFVKTNYRGYKSIITYSKDFFISTLLLLGKS